VVQRIEAFGGAASQFDDPAKLARTPLPPFGTGDATLNIASILRKFIAFVAGYHRNRSMKVAG
jgi:hypothetical protein